MVHLQCQPVAGFAAYFSLGDCHRVADLGQIASSIQKVAPLTMLRSLWFRCFIAFFTLLAGFGIYLVFTDSGSALLVRWALRIALKPQTVSVESQSGNFANGLDIQTLELTQPLTFGKGSLLATDSLAISPLSGAAIFSPEVRMQNVELSFPGKVDRIAIEKMSGEVGGEWTLDGVQAEGIQGLPQPVALEAQELRGFLPLKPANITKIRNASLRYPQQAPVIIDLIQDGDMARGGVFTESVDLPMVLGLFSKKPPLSLVDGYLSNVNMDLEKKDEHLTVSGPLNVSRLSFKQIQLQDTPVHVELDIPLTDPKRLKGRLIAEQGNVAMRGIPLRLLSATVFFDPKERIPRFQVRAETTVGNTEISVKLDGTFDKPEMELTSEPPKSEGLLLVMLATGRNWKPVDEAIGKQPVDGELARDFLDYVVSGGIGSQISSRFGVDILKLQMLNQKKAVEVQTTIRDRVDIRSGIGFSDTADSGTRLEQSVGVDLKVDKDTELQLDLQRETTRGAPTQEELLNPRKDEVSEEVMLKLKKSF